MRCPSRMGWSARSSRSPLPTLGCHCQFKESILLIFYRSWTGSQEAIHLAGIHVGQRRAACPCSACALRHARHLLAAIILNAHILKLVNRVIRDFLWNGRKDSAAGHCGVNWRRVCMPLELGRLGVRGLRHTGISLRTRWLWLQCMDQLRPWSHLFIPSDPEVLVIFRASTQWELGDGRSCKFWMDHWIHGQSVAEITPAIYAMVPKRCRRTRVVVDGLADRTWVQDIVGALGPLAMVQYIELWRCMRLITLADHPDNLCWRWTANGLYSAKSCYDALFLGSTSSPHATLTWKTFPPSVSSSSCGSPCRIGAGQVRDWHATAFRIPLRACSATRPPSPCNIS
ncbi:serine threonine-protein kinase smg1 [Hordeum vulgare]|nr:serine threonine-protein kinase smg1 [Hordeum vulgare]